MKKRLLLFGLLFTFILTGCNANYSLEIRNNIIKETFSLIDNSNSEKLFEKDEFGYSFYDYSKMYGQDKDIETDVEGFSSEEGCIGYCSFYDKSFFEDGTLGFQLTHPFTFEEYSSSTIARELIPGFSSTYDGRYLTISGGPNLDYSNEYNSLESINFSIITDYKVVSTNITKDRKGKYIWNNHDGDTSLYITMDTSMIIKNEENNNNFIILLIIFVGFLLIALIICSVNNRKKYR